jgi:imidazolonepropionase-like amidohydrolase
VNEVAVAGFKRALAAGIPIGLGTDAPVMPHGLIARELAYRVSLGEAPMKTIVASTSLNAEILGLQDRIGSATAGKLADLIAVGGNPLADVGVLEKVVFVMKGGTIYRHDAAGR